jgi:hypothetical protein
MSQVFRKFHWTDHSKIKMKQYGLSKQKIMGILRNPERKEKAIVPGLVAVMKTNKVYFSQKQITLKQAWKNPKMNSQKAPGEIWVMFKDTKINLGSIRKIISAWRYPGVTIPGEQALVPEDIKRELENYRSL